MMRLPTIVAGGLSIGFHVAFLLWVPAPAWQSLAPEPPARDVEVVDLDIPEPHALRLPPLELPPAPQPPPPPPRVPTFDASKIAALDVKQIDGAIEQVSAGASLRLSMPELALPERPPTESAPVTEALPLPEPDAAQVVASLLESSPVAAGLPDGQKVPVGLGQIRLGDKQELSRWALPTLKADVVAPPLPTPEPLTPQVPSQPFLGIQGPAAQRRALFQPELPQVVVQAESDITLKFWVRPDGGVSRVLTLRKGDATLEAAAIRYIEGWRFTPLPSYESQHEQWGTITVRFLVPDRAPTRRETEAAQ